MVVSKKKKPYSFEKPKYGSSYFQSIGPLGWCFLKVEMSVRVFVCLFVCLSVHLLRYRLNVFLPSFLESFFFCEFCLTSRILLVSVLLSASVERSLSPVCGIKSIWLVKIWNVSQQQAWLWYMFLIIRVTLYKENCMQPSEIMFICIGCKYIQYSREQCSAVQCGELQR